MKKICTRKSSVVWVNEHSQLKVYPFTQYIEGEGHYWGHPEELLFVHDAANCVREGNRYILTCEDQDVSIDCAKVFRFPDDISSAVLSSLVSNSDQRIEPLECDVAVLLADENTDPESMSWFFDLNFNMAPDYDERCPSCKLHLEQAEKIVGFLNEAVFIRKDSDMSSTNFLQRNMKRAIFISDTSKESILKWFVETFSITFGRAKIESVVLQDRETDDYYIEQVKTED